MTFILLSKYSVYVWVHIVTHSISSSTIDNNRNTVEMFPSYQLRMTNCKTKQIRNGLQKNCFLLIHSESRFCSRDANFSILIAEFLFLDSTVEVHSFVELTINVDQPNKQKMCFAL